MSGFSFEMEGKPGDVWAVCLAWPNIDPATYPTLGTQKEWNIAEWRERGDSRWLEDGQWSRPGWYLFDTQCGGLFFWEEAAECALLAAAKLEAVA